MSKRVAGTKGIKSRNFAHKKMPKWWKREIKRLKDQEHRIQEAHKQGVVDETKFNVREELGQIGQRIKTFYRKARARG